MKSYFICNASEIGEGDTKKFKYKGKDAILIKHNGGFKAFLDYCTHAGGSFEMKNGKLKCLEHGALFDPDTGCAESTPAPEASSLMEIKLEVKDGKISHLNTIIFKGKNTCEGHCYKRNEILL
jgi:nitrite reductase/ring-hydroxylating ferredoxin subunit